MNRLSHFWTWYQRSLAVRPIRTKTATAGFIFFSSDLATQFISWEEDDGVSVDFRRALSGAGFGVFGTLYLHYWWGFLEKLVEARLPSARSKLANTLMKVFIDQGFAAPLYYHNYYFFTNFANPKVSGTNKPGKELLFRERVQIASDRTRELALPTMIAAWKIWPAVVGFNFYFVPVQNRVLVQNLVLAVWSGYLSYLNHEQDRSKQADAIIRSMEKTTLKRRKTVFIGLDVVEEEVAD